ncbi:MAG: hypothetical protein ACI95C_002038 [Pseudohongiellaceae bacterium]|jgi:hypothetical protein
MQYSLPKTLGLVSVIILLAACAQTPPPPIPEILLPSVGEVQLQATNNPPPEEIQLEIGIRVFANRLNASDYERFGEWVFSEIRENEVNYLPYVLRNTLLDANEWGAVRVLPQDDPSVDLQISGTVLRSDGERLEVEVIAVDSSGRQWLRKTYADTTTLEDYPEARRYTPGNRFDPNSFTDPFQDLYDQVANDLLAIRQALATNELVNIKRVSEMVYARDLSPETFAHTLSETEAGLLTVNSLLAENDPMLARVAEMRLRHGVFIDTVDEYYEALYEEMQPSYVIWRRYSHDQIAEDERVIQQIAEYDIDNFESERTYLSLMQRYDRFRWSKIYEQEFRELAAGFNKELAPAVLKLSEQVNGVSGPMTEQYSQWRKILRDLFKLETQQM